MAFDNKALMQKLIFYPPAVQRDEWYRFFSCGLIHANITHLFFNMFTLFIFGREIEQAFLAEFGHIIGELLYLLLYVLSLYFCLIPTYKKQKNNPYYRSLGASGAVSAMVFAYMLIHPMHYMGLLFIPIYLPAFLFGFLYVVISLYLDKKQAGNINHSAHLFGGLFGLIFTFLVFSSMANVNLFYNFILQIKSVPVGSLIRFGF